MNARCSDCRFYEPDEENRGCCRRHPPQVLSLSDAHVSTLWPEVRVSDWCGEFSRRDAPAESQAEHDARLERAIQRAIAAHIPPL